MPELEGTVNAKRRGRPKLDVKETKVRLTGEQRSRIEALVGDQKMAEFIRDAIERELRRRERLTLPPGNSL
jgi:predicted DNA-binding protein